MATRHKIWSFTPTHSPVLGRRTDTNTHYVLNGLTVDSVQLKGEEEEGEKQKGKSKEDREGGKKLLPQQVCVVH